MIYFNHNEIQHRSYSNVHNCLVELTQMHYTIKENDLEISFYEQLWDTMLEGDTFLKYIYSLPDRDEVKSLIMIVMNSGPWYQYSTDRRRVLTVEPPPQPTINEFLEILFGICYENGQENILSLSEERGLIHPSYVLSYNNVNHKLTNLIGKTNLNHYIRNLQVFSCIDEVFTAIEQKAAHVVILENAKKSAKKHDFLRKFNCVYETIMELEKLEVLQYSVEEKQNLFKRITGFEISGESTSTLNIPRYRREREFVIPEVGKKVFEWHIKIGNTIRIHYYFDNEKQILFIGHCGNHLGTSNYNS